MLASPAPGCTISVQYLLPPGQRLQRILHCLLHHGHCDHRQPAGTWSSGHTRCCRSGVPPAPGSVMGSLWPGEQLCVIQPVLSNLASLALLRTLSAIRARLSAMRSILFKRAKESARECAGTIISQELSSRYPQTSSLYQAFYIPVSLWDLLQSPFPSSITARASSACRQGSFLNVPRVCP